MKLGIITSFIIGGLLMLSMIQFNNRVMQESAEVVLDANDKTKLETVRRIISQDFNRIGFGEGSKINNIKSDKIVFKADVYDIGTSTVIWHFLENKKIKETTNPRDRVLKRNGPVDSTGGAKPMEFNVVDFSIIGYKDTEGEIETTNTDDIKSILVEIVFETPEPVSFESDNPSYSKAVWRKLFVPNNLQFKNLNQ